MAERTIRVKKILAKRRITPYSVSENIEDVMGLLRAMVGAIDKILLVNEKLEGEGMGPLDKDVLSECWVQKRKLSAFVTKVAHASVTPGSLSEFGTRKVDERGLRLRSPVVDDNTHDAEEAVVDEDIVDDNTDGGMRSVGLRSKILHKMKLAQYKATKKVEERGLSRRQKLELFKKEGIRAQYPASMLREQETAKRTLGPKSLSDSIKGETRGDACE